MSFGELIMSFGGLTTKAVLVPATTKQEEITAARIKKQQPFFENRS